MSFDEQDASPSLICRPPSGNGDRTMPMERRQLSPIPAETLNRRAEKCIRRGQSHAESSIEEQTATAACRRLTFSLCVAGPPSARKGGAHSAKVIWIGECGDGSVDAGGRQQVGCSRSRRGAQGSMHALLPCCQHHLPACSTYGRRPCRPAPHQSCSLSADECMALFPSIDASESSPGRS